MENISCANDVTPPCALTDVIDTPTSNAEDVNGVMRSVMPFIDVEEIVTSVRRDMHAPEEMHQRLVSHGLAVIASYAQLNTRQDCQ